ncbi:hypothetical protein [Paenibacillus solani]|uniref:Uncharacterized protein n=1 Tax=Paenibacillus solani TaxID=1705565 RepID=A0A0M1P1W0_9BACL|nr:hypothetical protein [Paenibacillus solani]KOR88488.1 hypothetical protein AM231_04545 [Paenibacillus solani]
MAVEKSQGNRRAGVVLILLAGSIVGSGCSIPARTSVQLEPLQAPTAPVMLDVYSRSIQRDVYSQQGDGLLEPVSPMDSVDTLHDLNP